MNELWETIEHEKIKSNTIIAVSNFGRIKRANGIIEVSKLRDSVIRYKGHIRRIHRIIAELFLSKTEEDIKLHRNVIDHISHNPSNMNINDVKNLRWCTQKENMNFEEALNNKKGRIVSAETRKKLSESHKGKKHSEETLNKMKGRTPWNKHSINKEV